MDANSPAPPPASAIARLQALRYTLTRMDLMRLMLADPHSVAWLGVTLALVRALGRPAMYAMSALTATSAATLGLKGNVLWLYVLPFTLVFLLPVGTVQGLIWWWLARIHARHGFEVEHVVDFDADGLSHREGPRDFRVAWGSVRGASDFNHALLLRFGYRADLLIPNRAFANRHQRELLLETLRDRAHVTIEVPEPRGRDTPEYFSWEGRARRLRWAVGVGFFAFLVLIVALAW